MTINWPTNLDRTDAGARERSSSFDVSQGKAVADLETELDRLDPLDWSVDIANGHTKTNGMPLHNANPDDPGFVLQWTKDGRDYAVACDHYASLRDNVREVGLWLKETRKRSNRPVVTGAEEYAAARLPPGGQTGKDAVALPAEGESEGWASMAPHEVLGVAADAGRVAIDEAFRERVKQAHPDNGGSFAEVDAVREARKEMRGRLPEQ